MNNRFKSIKKFWVNALKTKEDKHSEFINKEFEGARIIKVEGVKYE